MNKTVRRRLQVLAGTTFGGVVATKIRGTVLASDDSKPWSSSYINLGADDFSVIANRSVMNQQYVKDVRKLQDSIQQCPKHTALFQQPAYLDGGRARLRILTWNINMLCGPDGSASVGSHKRIDPDAVADVIKKANPDIICLQETIDWMPAKYKDFMEKHGVGDMDERMQRLNLRLMEQGFEKLLRSCIPDESSPGSPNLVASRLPFNNEEIFNLAPEMSHAYGVTPRSAAYIEVALTGRGTQSLGVYCTHLHHIAHSPVEGRRAIEIQSLIDHASSRRSGSQRLATVVTGDFNQARIQDYTATEWRVIAAGLSKVQQPQVDGVDSALSKHEFVCAYDSSAPLTNFGGRATPPFTHWTGTTVDYLYFLDESRSLGNDISIGHASVHGTYVIFSDLSDHLPIVTDLELVLPTPRNAT